MRRVILQEAKKLWALATPLILAQLAQTSLGLIDTLMAGRLGREALAGVALGSVIFNFVLIVSAGFLFAVGPLVSQAHGAGRIEEAARAARQGLWLALALALPCFFLFRSLGPLLQWIGQAPETVALAAAYLKAISWGLAPVLLYTALRGFLEGLADARPLVGITLLGVLLKLLATYSLMFGRWGMPELGLVGAGYGTSLGFGLMLLLIAVRIERKHRRYQVLSGLRTPDPTILLELLRVGWPIGLGLGFEAGLFTVTALLMGLFGATALAAYQIAMQTVSFTFMVPSGIAIATSVRVGQAAGRGSPDGVARAGVTGITLSAAFMALVALVYWLAPDFVVGLYLDGSSPERAEVAALARNFLALAALFQVFDGVQVSTAAALRGLKDTRIPMLLALVSYWLLGVPIGAALAFLLAVGSYGLWLGLVIGLASAALLLLWRFRRVVRRWSRLGVEGHVLPGSVG